MTNDLHQLRHASDDEFVARIHQALSAMQRSVCDSSQAVKDDARKAFKLSDAQRGADAGCDLAGCEGNGVML